MRRRLGAVNVVSQAKAIGRNGEEYRQDHAGREAHVRALSVSTPATYRITLSGSLSESWSDTLGGMTVAVSLDEAQRTVTTLMGTVKDQAMLLGVLNCVYDLGLPLISVQWLDKGAD